MTTQITEKQVEKRFNNIHTINQALQFVKWIEINSFNMDKDLYDVAIKAGNQYYKELKDKWLSSKQVREEASKSTKTLEELNTHFLQMFG